MTPRSFQLLKKQTPKKFVRCATGTMSQSSQQESPRVRHSYRRIRTAKWAERTMLGIETILSRARQRSNKRLTEEEMEEMEQVCPRTDYQILFVPDETKPADWHGWISDPTKLVVAICRIYQPANVACTQVQEVAQMKGKPGLVTRPCKHRGINCWTTLASKSHFLLSGIEPVVFCYLKFQNSLCQSFTLWACEKHQGKDGGEAIAEQPHCQDPKRVRITGNSLETSDLSPRGHLMSQSQSVSDDDPKTETHPVQFPSGSPKHQLTSTGVELDDILDNPVNFDMFRC